MRLIYLASPFGGKPENVEKAKAIIKVLIKKHPDCVFVSPLLCFGCYYNDLDYLTGMEHCFLLLDSCAEAWFCPGWVDSKGCCMEYAYCLAKGITSYALAEEECEESARD